MEAQIKKARDYFRDIPIRHKLSIIISLSIVFALVMVTAAIVVYETRTFKIRTLLKLDEQADILAEMLVPSLQLQDSAAATKHMQALRYWKEINAAALYDSKGQFFVGYHASARKQKPPPRIAPDSGGVFLPEDLTYSTAIFSPAGQRIGTFWVDQALLPLYGRLPRYGIMFGVVILSLSAVGFVVGQALKRSVSIPIISLANTAKSVIDRRDYSLRAVDHGRDEIGNLTQVFNQMLAGIEQRDISLRQSEERFSKAFMASPVPISLVRASDHAILDMSPSGLVHLGFTRDEVIGRTSLGLGILKPDRFELIGKLMRETGSIRKLEMKITTKSGEIRDVLLSMEILHVEGAPCFIVTVDDITDRMQAEEKFRQSQKMEAIGLLAGGIAHDFNNLLTTMIGYSSLALESLEPTEALHYPLRQILRAGERAVGLTGQLLAYSRKQILEFKIWDLNLIALEMEEMLKRLIREDIELHSVLASGPCLAKVDRGQIEQIILNLAVNARDAMSNGGKLTLETSRQLLDKSFQSQLEVKPGPHIVLSISDNGTGMNAEVRAKLFEPYFTTKDVGKGSGLGLSVVYGIVKQSGGTISVYSEPGLGSTFRIYLPEASAAEGEVQTTPVSEAAGAYRGAETILLVEDEEMVRTFSRSVLESRGYRVLEAMNGLDALRWFENKDESINLVISDFVMPDMGGRVLANRIKAKYPHLPVIFVSGYSDHGFRNKGGLEQGDRFLQKPFSPGSLVKLVRETLDQPGNAST